MRHIQDMSTEELERHYAPIRRQLMTILSLRYPEVTEQQWIERQMATCENPFVHNGDYHNLETQRHMEFRSAFRVQCDQQDHQNN